MWGRKKLQQLWRNKEWGEDGVDTYIRVGIYEGERDGSSTSRGCERFSDTYVSLGSVHRVCHQDDTSRLTIDKVVLV